MGSCGMGTAVSTGHSRRMPAVPQGVTGTWVYILALLLIGWVSGVGMRGWSPVGHTHSLSPPGSMAASLPLQLSKHSCFSSARPAF